ncbi:MAG TPA: S8 family serine peptidase [Gaiellaceae bacterium]
MLGRLLVLLASLALVSAGGSAPPTAFTAGHIVKPRKVHRRVHRPAPPRSPATLVPDDPLWGAESGLAHIGLPRLWAASATVPGAVVAVVDTGADPGRSDLAGALVGASGDAVGHGTAVAEIAAGRGNDGVGAAGVCWRCRVLSIDVAPDGTASAASLAAGIDSAVAQGANVINLSLVLNEPDAGVAAAIANAEARGVLVVAAAGNDGGTAPTYPAAYPGVVSVVGVDDADHPYPWATRGSWATLAAPGCATVADASGGAAAFCGSSAAAPVVSGLAGLVWNKFGSAEAVRAALVASAAPLDGGVASAGRVDAARLASLLP